MKRLLCLVVGHRWREADDDHESYGVLRCARCGKHRLLAGAEVDRPLVGGRHPYPGSGDD